jgi:hypothetical protein
MSRPGSMAVTEHPSAAGERVAWPVLHGVGALPRVYGMRFAGYGGGGVAGRTAAWHAGDAD